MRFARRAAPPAPVTAALVAALVAALAAHGCRANAPAAAQNDVILELAPAAPLAFARALEPRSFVLPLDHGPHFAFQTEWWYYTGQLDSADGRRFGFQLTFFRRGLSPGPPPSDAGLASNQVYFAHFAVTDVATGRHAFAERVGRGVSGFAGAAASPFRVYVEEWSVEAEDAAGSAVRVRAREGGLTLDLQLAAAKPLVAHGEHGLSAKSDEPGNASYYVGYTRMSARGRIGHDGREAEVAGEAWFDHEWSTNALGAAAVGWDWWSLQLDDGRELMLFEIRRADGSRAPAASGTLVARDGRTQRLHASDFETAELARWTSPHSGASYPARWGIRLPGEQLELTVEPLVADQELRTGFVYWEGAVSIAGTSRGRPVAGRGYVELTGYARSMQGVL